MGLKRKSEGVEKKEKQFPDKKTKYLKNVTSKNKNVIQDTKGEKMSKDTPASRKARKVERKMYKPNYELSIQTLKIWEKLRNNKSCSKADASKLVDELLVLIKEQEKNLSSLVFAHSTSRVVQSCLKQGNKRQRTVIYEELKDEFVNMCKNRYAKNVAWKLVKYGTPEQRDEMVHRFAGKVARLIRKQDSASVIEYLYNTYANLKQRNFLAYQLYGNVFNATKTDADSTLEAVLTEQPEKRTSVLANFKQCLVPLVEKQVILHTIVHRAFKDFFTHCDDSQLRGELIELLRESVIHIMHTRDGAHVAMHCLWHGTAKDRKVIVKTMKEFISKLSQEEYGHLALIAAFDSVDDTVFLKKSLILPLIKLVPEILSNKFARKVILYLICPRNPSYFLPETTQLLSLGDNNTNSKKPLEKRHKELSEAVSPGLIKYVSDNIKDLMCDRSLFVLVESVMMFGSGDLSSALKALIHEVALPFTKGSKEQKKNLHIIEDPAGHLLMKHLILKPTETGNDLNYAQELLEAVDSVNLCSWASCNRGSLLLLCLLQSSDQNVSQKVEILMKANIHILKKSDDNKSLKILLEKLQC